MSTELKSLIRPFQSREVTPSQTYYEPGQKGDAKYIVLQIGRDGTGKTLTGNYSYSATFYCEQNQVQLESDVGGGYDPNRGEY